MIYLIFCYKLFLGIFNWDDYLKETNAEPAPHSCFKQVILYNSNVDITSEKKYKSNTFSSQLT